MAIVVRIIPITRVAAPIPDSPIRFEMGVAKHTNWQERHHPIDGPERGNTPNTVKHHTLGTGKTQAMRARSSYKTLLITIHINPMEYPKRRLKSTLRRGRRSSPTGVFADSGLCAARQQETRQHTETCRTEQMHVMHRQ